MPQHLDLSRIAGAVDLLETIETDGRLTSLIKLIINNNGRMDLPSEQVGEYDPIIKSVQLFGVYAMSEDLDDLPKNWLRAARNILDGAAHTPNEAA